MLDVQYRMHPAINQFPSKYFYDNRLLTHESVLARSPPPDEDVRLGPYVFFDVAEGHEDRKQTSLQNFAEARFTGFLCYSFQMCRIVAELFQFLKSAYGAKDSNFAGRVGIITPYGHQVQLLRAQLRNALPDLMVSNPLQHKSHRHVVRFRQWTASKGPTYPKTSTCKLPIRSEKDFIIFSCVRANEVRARANIPRTLYF